MANSIQVLNPATGQYYTVSVYCEGAITLQGEDGTTGFYLRVSTSQPDAEGNPIPDQLLTSFGTDKFTVAVNNAIHVIMDLVAGVGSYSFSSSSSHSSRSSLSGSSSHH